MSPTAIRRFEVYVAYPLTGAVLALRGSEFVCRACPGYFGAASDFRFLVGTLFLVGVALVMLWWAVKWFRPRPAHFRNMAAFPPGLASVFLGYGIFLLLFAKEQAPAGVEWLALSWPPLLALAFIFMAMPTPKARPGPGKPENGAVKTFGDWTTSELLGWLRVVDPIDSPSNDLISASTKAARIAEVITEASSEPSRPDSTRTVAIRGPYGVGKSSLILLAEQIVHEKHGESFIFVHSNCWGFESSARAQEQVLELCVEALAEHVDCNMLRRLPAHYGDALQKSDGWMKPLLLFAFGETSPLSQLQRFAEPLRAIGANLVVVIEDADRNGAGFDTGQILAMLHHMRRVPRMTFIVSASRDSQIELFKVADEVVFIDPVSWQQGLEVADRVRALALRHPGYIDPESLRAEKEARRAESLLADAGGTSFVALMLTQGQPSWARDVGTLLGAMRVLKGALRDFQTRWSRLHGEVDPDDLLIACALRHAAPKVYDFLQRHSTELEMVERNVAGEAAHKEFEALVAKLQARWQQACTDADFHIDAAAGLAAELFPGMSKVSGIAAGFSGGLQKVRRTPARYFVRIHMGSADPTDVPEKTVVSLLAAARNGPGAEGTARLADAVAEDVGLMKAVRDADTILGALTPERRLMILSDLLTRERNAAGRTASTLSDRVNPLIDWLPIQGGNLTEMVQWYGAEIRACLPDHAFLACGLVHRAQLNPALVPHFSPDLHAVFEEKLRCLSARQFADMLDPDQPYTLRYLLAPLMQGPNESTIPEWIAEIILAAMRLDPDRMMLPVSTTFAGPEFTGGVTGSREPLEANAISRFFGPRTGEFYSLLAGYSTTGSDDRSSFLRAAADFAKRHAGTPPQTAARTS